MRSSLLLLSLALLPLPALAAEADAAKAAPTAVSVPLAPTENCAASYALKSLGRTGADAQQTGVAFSFGKDPRCLEAKKPVTFEISSDQSTFVALKAAPYVSKLQQGASHDGEQARFALAAGHYTVRARLAGVAAPVGNVALTVK